MSHPDIDVFSIVIPRDDPEAMGQFQKAMNDLADAQIDYEKKTARELNISEACARDVCYLRTRSRWSEENETELIRLYQIGNPPNIFEWP